MLNSHQQNKIGQDQGYTYQSGKNVHSNQSDHQMKTPNVQKVQNQGITTSPFNSTFQLICEIHPEEFLTNYCIQFECMQALCPECVDEHQKFHKDNKTHSDIKNFKNVRQKCSQKLKEGTIVINKQLEQIQQNQYSSQNYQSQLKEIEQVRNQLIQRVKTRIDEVSQRLTGQISVKENTGLSGLKDKIQKIIIDQNKQLQLLDGPQSLDIIKKIFGNEFQKTFNDLNNQFNTYKDEVSQMDIVVNDSRLGYIDSELDNFIYLQKAQTIKKQEAK